jgi:mitogen-activated protein kinase organizer 1
MSDKFVVSGSEDGRVYVWDLLEGKVIEKLDLRSDTADKGDARGNVVSAVAWKAGGIGKEWASGGTDGTVIVWGMP